MFRIKRICQNEKEETVIREGLIATQLGRREKLAVLHQFWGDTDIHMERYMNINKLPVIEQESLLLPYIDEYKISDIGNGRKRIEFWLTGEHSKDTEGYIVFISRKNDIVTSGGAELLYRKDNDAIVLLREGEWLEVDGLRVEVEEFE